MSAAAGQSPPSASSASEHAFRIFVRGTQVGTERVAVERTGTGFQIAGSSRAGPPLDYVVQSATLTYDSQWRPLEVNVSGTRGRNFFGIESRFEGGQVSSLVTDPSATVTEQDPVAPDAIVILDSFFGSYEALAARLAGLEPGARLPVYIAPVEPITVRLDQIRTERVQTAARLLQIRRYQLTFERPAGPLGLEIWSDEDDRLVRVSVPTIGFDVVREDVGSVAARLTQYWRERDEDVRIRGAGFSIAATLSLPADDELAGEDGLPAIVLVPGTGPMDRDQTIASYAFYGQLSGALADEGFAVVRYDPRGIGQTGGRPESATLGDYARDALSITEWLEDRDDIDEEQIVIVGAGDGARVAMVAAERERDLAAVVLLGAVPGPGTDVVLDRQQRQLTLTGVPEAERQEKVDLQRRINQAVLGQSAWEGIPPDVQRQADTPFFRSFLEFDPAQIVPRLRQPVLVARAELDSASTPEHAERLLELAASRDDGRTADRLELEGVNQLLFSGPAPEPVAPDGLEERQIERAAVADLAAWIRRILST